jgi:hypothetical protein
MSKRRSPSRAPGYYTSPAPAHARRCSADGCDRPNYGHGYCRRHLERVKKYGSVELPVREKDIWHWCNGYLVVAAPNHPLADKTGAVYEHRMVLYDKLAGTVPCCHWCGGRLTWETLHADHLDDDKANNGPTNLVPSHPTCNQARGQHEARRTQRKKYGVTFNGETFAVVRMGQANRPDKKGLVARLQRGLAMDSALSVPSRNTRGLQ